MDKAGREHVLLVNIKRVSIKLGTILFTCRDITERKRAEQARQKSEEFLSVVYNNSEVGIFVVKVTESGEYIYEGINPTYEKITGVANTEIVGKTPRDLVKFFGQDTVEYIQSLYAKEWEFNNLCI